MKIDIHWFLEIVCIYCVKVSLCMFQISTFLSGNRRPGRPYRSEDPTEWILNKRSSRLQELISRAKNESLFNDIEDLVKEQGSDEDTSCIRLLVCKITPFVQKMQEAVFGKDGDGKREKLRGAEIMYRHLPSTEEINKRGDICERRHRDCDLNQWSSAVEILLFGEFSKILMCRIFFILLSNEFKYFEFYTIAHGIVRKTSRQIPLTIRYNYTLFNSPIASSSIIHCYYY